MEKLLPQNIEAECGVLGSIIIDDQAIDKVAEIIVATDFYKDNHQMIYEAMLELHRRREPADFIMLCNELEEQKKLDMIGGMSYITALINQVPTSGNASFYALIVEEKSIRRQLMRAAGEIAALAADESIEATEAVRQAEAKIHALGQRRMRNRMLTIAQVMERYMIKLAELEEAKQRGLPTGIPTGFTALDRMTGGFQKSDLIVLAARPGKGKTSLALNIGVDVMLNEVAGGYNVVLFSVEMPVDQLARRMLSMETGIDQKFLKNADLKDEPIYWRGVSYESEWALAFAMSEKLAQGRMWIDDTPAIKLSDIASRSRAIQSEHGLDLIIVDYMGLTRIDAMAGKPENRYLEMSAISRELKQLARELDVPVLALSQLSRAVEQHIDKVPQLSDLRDSGSIEQDADGVIFIYQEPNATPNVNGHEPISLMIAKQRNGPVGTIDLWFHPATTRFFEIVAIK